MYERYAELGAAALEREPSGHVVQSVEGKAAAAQQLGTVFLRNKCRHGLKAQLRRNELRPFLSGVGLAAAYERRGGEQLAVEVRFVKNVAVRGTDKLRAETEHVLKQPAAQSAQARYKDSARQKRHISRPLFL